MKFLKYFESKKKSRLVDIASLYNDFIIYRKQLFEPTINLSDKFHKIILEPILLNKDVEFHRVKNKIDGDVTYGFSGKITAVEIKREGYIMQILVKLYDKPSYYILVKNLLGLEPIIVKIYNSEKTEIEKKIELLKDTEKYNL